MPDSAKIMTVPINDSSDKLLPELNIIGVIISASAKPTQTSQRPKLIGE